MTTLDYTTVSRYWDRARPSILGPYMMDGFGFPATAGEFRFRGEGSIVKQLTDGTDPDGCVLDLGSGIGCWTEYFAPRFARVVAVEASRPLFDAMQERCGPYPNVTMIHGDVMLFHPEDHYEVVFLGGMLMYLNEDDVISLLKKLTPFLQPEGIILCRETTVRKADITRSGDYQAVYRSLENYGRIFSECGLSAMKVQMNLPYVVMQMGCEFVNKWKTTVPARMQLTSFVGRLVYWFLRLGYPWIGRVPTALGWAYPELTNHFFVLQAREHPTSNSTSGNLAV
jgi:16S rRNA A1518/A1519 N6-dimethyltransferase RsmA/KsgA/DIM1 with predicted DNA glycosylase/AP lyase activity